MGLYLKDLNKPISHLTFKENLKHVHHVQK